MKKIDTHNINIKFLDDEYSFVLDIKGDDYQIKRIKKSNDEKEIVILSIKNNILNIKQIDKNNDNILLTNKDKSIIINDIFNSLEKSNLVKTVLNLSEFKNIIINLFTNILINNENIALGTVNGNINNLEIIDLINYNIIGEVKIKDNNISIDVNRKFYYEVLFLLNNLLYVNKNNDHILKKSKK